MKTEAVNNKEDLRSTEIFREESKGRAKSISDIENIYRGLSHPEVIKYYGVSYNSLEATKVQMEWFKEPQQLCWAICDAENKIDQNRSTHIISLPQWLSLSLKG